MLALAVTSAPTRTQLRLAVLVQWVEAGLALARRLTEEAERGLIHAARTVYRISRAVRLALILHARLSDPDCTLFQPKPARAPAAQAKPETERQAEPETEEPETEKPARPPVSDARDFRLSDDFGSDDAILRRPLREIIKVICAALGVTPDWSLWSDTDADTPPAEPAGCAQPRPHPLQILERLRPDYPRRPPWIIPPEPARPVARLLTRLRSSCAPLALDPLATPASGGFRLAEG